MSSQISEIKVDEASAASDSEESRIHEIENLLLQGLFGCRTFEAVEAAITYARFLSSVGITPENYPVFLRILEVENHWVIDALIGERDPFLLLSGVQPNRYIVGNILAMMTRWHKGGIYPKNLSVILGVLQSVYSSPKDGYRIHALTIADCNAIGKHLDKEKGQDGPLNRAILEVLEKISSLEDAKDSEMEEVAIHASAIRNAFFDDRKEMEGVIPPVLLVSGNGRPEVAPRNTRPVNAAAPKGGKAKQSKSAAKEPEQAAQTSQPPKAGDPN